MNFLFNSFRFLTAGNFLPLIILVFIFSSCEKDQVIVQYKTKNVIVIVVDGPRYMETWGDEQHRFIPQRFSRKSEAVICTKMYNEGITNTMNGHAALLTGNYISIDNSGLQNPEFPSFHQHAQSFFGMPANKTWIIASKDKIAALGNCTQSDWKDLFLPQLDCGVSGLNSAYRHDSITFFNVKNILSTFHPSYVLINFREPDFSAHSADSLGYLKGIKDTDSMAIALLDFIQNDPFYSGNTTFIITNDHGRHLPGQGGYTSHGDNCEGCRHTEFFAVSPDFKRNYISQQRYSMIDITATIAEITGVKMEFGKGKVMWDILQEYERW